MRADQGYKMPGITVNTGAGVVTPKTIDELVPLIEAGIRQPRQGLGCGPVPVSAMAARTCLLRRDCEPDC